MEKTTGLRVAGLGAAAALALALTGGPVAAQAVNGQWLPFLGCWQPIAGTMEAGSPQEAVCVSTQAAGGVELATVVDGQVTARRTLVADGQRRDVQESGCSGWEQARWSEDGQRVYLRSEMSCEGGTTRVTSGAITMASPTEWLHAQSVEAGGYPMMRVLRYRLASEEIARAAGIPAPQGVALALENARTAAAEPLSVGDVKEAARELSTETLEALLYERGGMFEIDAAALVELADAGVPEQVVDLVVALAYPKVFAVNSDARMVGVRPDEPNVSESEPRQGRRVYADLYDPFYGYGWSRYGYGSGYYGYSPFGWGSPYGWYTGRPVIVIQQPSNGARTNAGRIVRGRGYTRDAPSTDLSGTRDVRRGDDSRATGSGSGSSGSGAASSTGSSSGRTAKRRGGS